MKNTSNGNKNNVLAVIVTLFVGFLSLHGCSSSSSPDNRPSLSVNSPSIIEGAGGSTTELVFTITLSAAAASALTVEYTTTDDVATVANNDYTLAQGTATIAVGSTTSQISVFVNDDAVFEVNETFNLVVDNPTGLSIKTSSVTGQGTITNDDNANPKGYFSGTSTLNSINLTDMTGMMFNNRLMMFSTSQNVLFDITSFSSTVSDYTATVDVYEAGLLTQTGIALSGTTDEASISGTFSGGSGLAVGSFNIVFDVDNNIGATLARIEATSFGRWTGNIFGIDNDSSGQFISDAIGDYSISDNNSPSCAISFDASLNIPSNIINIFELNHDVLDNDSCQYISSGHTGFASVLSLNAVDTIVFSYDNGAISVFGVMTK